MLELWQQVLCVAFLILAPWSGGGMCVGSLVCEGQDACSCVFNDGSGVIDISSLGNTDGTPRFKNVTGKDNYVYSYNPCRPFHEGNCTAAAACQQNSSAHSYVQIGDANTARWLGSPQAHLRFHTRFPDRMMTKNTIQGRVNVTVYYEHQVRRLSLLIRESFVTYICDPTAETPIMNATGMDDTQQTFFFSLTTKCACPNGCVSSHSGGGGLSGGSVLLIIFFVVLFVYLLGGMLYNRTQRQSTGVEMVPNITFWRALPGYVKDGCLFVSCQYKKGTYTEVN